MRLRKKLATRVLEVALAALALLALGEYIALQEAAQAAVDLVTVPKRDTVQLTIYNSADITLAKDRRTLTFKKGENQIQFSWANTLIDPTSVEFRPLKYADKVEVIDTTYPANRPDTLIWNIKSDVEGAVPVEITYFTSGLTWQADYVAIATPDESKIDLSGLVKVVNNSGEDYEDAQVRLVVGTIHLVENIADLARRGYRRYPQPGKEAIRRRYEKALRKAAPAAPRAAERPEEAKKIVKEGLSEYFIYTIEGKETVPNRWAKRMPSLNVTGIPVKAIYRYAEHKYGAQVVRFYKFKNRKVEGKPKDEPNLGEEPLPNGMVRVFKRDKDGNLSFIGQQQIKYMPIGEDVEINLGADPDVLLERKLMDFKKRNFVHEMVGPAWQRRGRVTGHDTEHSYHTRIRNTKTIAIQFEIERRFSGDWELESRQRFDKLDEHTVRFVLQLKPGEEKKFSYKLITHHGKNSRK